MHTPRVYVASPLFTDDQIKVIKDVVALCENAGYLTYNAYIDGISLKKLPEIRREHRQEAVLTDIHCIRRCDLVVAVIEPSDTGTAFEMGYAHAFNIPIVTYSPISTRGSKNVMLVEGDVSFAHAYNIDDLGSIITDLYHHLEWGRRVSPNDVTEFNSLRAKMFEKFYYSGPVE